MDVDQVVSKGWSRHAAEPEAVFDEARAAVAHAQAGQVPALGGLLFHVGGEHLGRFAEVREALLALDGVAPGQPPVWRAIAAAHLCEGNAESATEAESRAGGGETTAGMVRALASTALAGQARTTEAMALFQQAASYGRDDLDAQDPLARSLAINGNNLAASLEEKPSRTPEENELMLEAARVARRFWAIAGNWMNVERAEYRLAMSNLAAGRPAAAVEHAEACLVICEQNGNDPTELFFAYQALCKTHAANGESDAADGARTAAAEQIERITDAGMREYAAGEFAKLP